jgi:hypothetical protein
MKGVQDNNSIKTTVKEINSFLKVKLCPKLSFGEEGQAGRKRFHKDNLQHLARFPDFFAFKERETTCR